MCWDPISKMRRLVWWFHPFTTRRIARTRRAACFLNCSESSTRHDKEPRSQHRSGHQKMAASSNDPVAMGIPVAESTTAMADTSYPERPAAAFHRSNTEASLHALTGTWRRAFFSVPSPGREERRQGKKGERRRRRSGGQRWKRGRLVKELTPLRFVTRSPHGKRKRTGAVIAPNPIPGGGLFVVVEESGKKEEEE